MNKNNILLKSKNKDKDKNFVILKIIFYFLSTILINSLISKIRIKCI